MTDADDVQPSRKLAIHTKILIGLLVGAILGVTANNLFGGEQWLIDFIDGPVYFVGQVFLRIIFMVVIPLLFSALTLGVAELGDIRKLGRIGARTFGYTLIVTTISVVIGLAIVNIVQPGHFLSEESKQELIASTDKDKIIANAETAKKTKTVDKILQIIPNNPIGDMANSINPHPAYAGSGFIAVMFFAFIFGLGLAMSDPDTVAPIIGVLKGIYAAVMKIIDFAMSLAPYAVACLIFATTARLGFSVFKSLAAYVAVVLVALAIHQFGTYSVLVYFLAKMNPITFFSKIREVMITAFSTSSSNATLPTAMRVTEEKLGVPREITGFVLTLGSTANQNGTALYEGITVLFLAQVFNVDLTFGQQITVLLMSILAGIGTAGVPGGSLPLVVLVLQSVNVPAEGIAIILGVDRILDMSRTVLNVTGDITAAAYVARAEGVVLKT
ncbi:MAG: dicarboxylate/amino acid:cation symporter [Blastocatellia bacterium]|nr:dicarboxylate/amino acid:cation symporter [Blastocatellia bacterium]MBK6428523.1 dicarboxylate/amino acid:cation symporter [Blastocatellia bacterium]